MFENFLPALILTMLAGLSTAIGSFITIFIQKPSPAYMAVTLGFSAGVMILVSFVELLHSGISTIGFAQAHIAFFLGMIIMFIIDISISHDYILEKYACHHDHCHCPRMMKTSMLVAFGIAIHNFPEGIATFTATIKDVNLGFALAAAIAIHNIPEGIAVAIPVYASTKSHKKAFWWSFLSGVSEPLGAIIAALILLPILNEIILAWTLCIVAGLMVYISFDELLPASRGHGREHLSILGVIIGMMVMAVSLYALK